MEEPDIDLKRQNSIAETRLCHLLDGGAPIAAEDLQRRIRCLVQARLPSYIEQKVKELKEDPTPQKRQEVLKEVLLLFNMKATSPTAKALLERLAKAE